MELGPKSAKWENYTFLKKFCQPNKVSNGGKDLLMLNQLAVGSTEYHSLKIERKQGGSIHVQSTGGPLFSKSVGGEIITCRNKDLWLNTDVHKPERRSLPKQIGLKPYKRNLLPTLPRQIHQQAAEYEDMCDLEIDETEDMDYLPDINAPTPLQKLLTNDNFELIQDILDELQQYDMGKWQNVQVFVMY